MRGDRLRTRWFALLSLTAAPLLAAPPTVSFLRPERTVVSPGESVPIRLEAGAGVDPRSAWPADGVEWLFVRAAGTQANRHDVRPADGDTVLIPITQPGVTMIGVDQRSVNLDVTAAELLAFADQAGASAVEETLRLVAPETSLRVRHVASAKALVRTASPSPRPSMIATSKAGQAVEIRVHVDPTVMRGGHDVPLVIYVSGDKRPGLQVRATAVATGETFSIVTDAGGAGRFRIRSTGSWRLEFHEIVPVSGDPSIDWAIATATLTFDVPLQAAPP